MPAAPCFISNYVRLPPAPAPAAGAAPLVALLVAHCDQIAASRRLMAAILGRRRLLLVGPAGPLATVPVAVRAVAAEVTLLRAVLRLRLVDAAGVRARRAVQVRAAVVLPVPAAPTRAAACPLRSAAVGLGGDHAALDDAGVPTLVDTPAAAAALARLRVPDPGERGEDRGAEGAKNPPPPDLGGQLVKLLRVHSRTPPFLEPVTLPPLRREKKAAAPARF